MKISKSASIDTFDELIKMVQKLDKEKSIYNFSGQVREDGRKFYSINWDSEEEI